MVSVLQMVAVFLVPGVQIFLGLLWSINPRKWRYLLYRTYKDFGDLSEEQIDDDVRGWGYLSCFMGLVSLVIFLIAFIKNGYLVN